MSKKWKIHEKVITHFVEFRGFMVCKMTSSISWSFLLKKNCQIMHCSQRYLHFFDNFSSFVSQISLPTKHYFAIWRMEMGDLTYSATNTHVHVIIHRVALHLKKVQYVRLFGARGLSRQSYPQLYFAMFCELSALRYSCVSTQCHRIN